MFRITATLAFVLLTLAVSWPILNRIQSYEMAAVVSWPIIFLAFLLMYVSTGFFQSAIVKQLKTRWTVKEHKSLVEIAGEGTQLIINHFGPNEHDEAYMHVLSDTGITPRSLIMDENVSIRRVPDGFGLRKLQEQYTGSRKHLWEFLFGAPSSSPRWEINLSRHVHAKLVNIPGR